MLSRVADSLYWMSRYLERAEHTSRLIDVNLHQMLDQTPMAASQRWDRLFSSLRVSLPNDATKNAYTLTNTLTFDLSHTTSIAGCIGAARENARHVREQLSSEMWEQLNRLFLYVKHTNMDHIWHGEPHEFFRFVKEGAHLFQGITDATMSHGEGWQFIQIGRSIERAIATAILLDVHLNPASPHRAETPDYLTFVGLLKSCTAFEAYCKVYSTGLKLDCIAEFLLFNAEFPRSLRFCAGVLQDALQAVADSAGQRSSGRVKRLVGRLRASLEYSQVDEILDGSMHTYLEDIQQQCVQIHNAIYQTYITYPIDTALASQV